ELQQKAEKTELLQVELQMLETERVRLSLVEEKLVDILQLLQQLRDLEKRTSWRCSMLSITNWPPVRFCPPGDVWTEHQVSSPSTRCLSPADEGAPCWAPCAVT
ncbi:unnamed protein product, partial [Tetraodon nigroviridis]